MYVVKIRDHITELRDINLEHMLSEKLELSEDDALTIAAIKIGF